MSSFSRLALACGFASALCAAPGASLAGELADTTFVPGDRLQGTIDYAGDADELGFEALRGMKLKVIISPLQGAGVARPQVLDPWRKSLGPKGRIKAGKSALVTLKSSGDHTLRVDGGTGVSGGYEVTTSVVLPKNAKARTVKVKASKALDATASVDLLRGALLDATIEISGEPGELDFEAVSPAGEVVHLGAWMGVGAEGEWLLTGFPATLSGTWKIRVTGLLSRKAKVTFRFEPTQPSGATTRQLLECVLPPSATPTVGTQTYGLDPALTIGPGTGALGVLTATDSGPLGVVEGLEPDVTQIVFLTDATGQPFAPFVVRPADGLPGAGDVLVSAQRVALGLVGMHPAVARVDAAQRERFFDEAPNAPSFPFLLSAARSALADDPLSLPDPAKYGEVYRSAAKAATETIALIGAAQLKSFHTPWGDYDVPATFDVQGSTCGKAVLINPRAVFYGVEGVGPRGVRAVGLVPPRDATISTWPPVESDPTTVGLDVPVGRTDFTADAIAASFDLDTPGGMGTTANALCAALHVFHLTTPTSSSPVEMTERLVRQLAEGQVPQDADLAAELGALVWSRTPAQLVADVQQFLSANNGRNWKKLAYMLWRWNPGTFEPGHLAGAGRFLGAFLAVGDVGDAMPFLADVSRVAGEPPLSFSVTRKGLDVDQTQDAPYAFEADFAVAPTVPSVGELTTFTPTALPPDPPVTPTYRWTIYDDPAAAPIVVDRGIDPSPATHAFAFEGFHLVALEVTVGPDVARTFHVVQVQSLPNLGFELGDMSNWAVETHTWWDPTPITPIHSAVVDQGFDAWVPTLPRVFHGLYSLRIENDGTGAYISSASRTIQVPPGGMILKFAWAAVLEDPQHVPSEQPYFDIRVRDVTAGEDLYAIHHYSNEPGFPWQTVPGSWDSIKWVPWQPETIDLTGRDGHEVVVAAVAADCEPTGHFGYVYLDAP